MAAVPGGGPLEAGGLKDLGIMNRMFTDRNKGSLGARVRVSRE
jgi:hypothetical protein